MTRFNGTSPARFLSALPIWPAGRSREMNLSVGFRAVLDVAEPLRAMLRVTASSAYRGSVNGEFVGYGPARGPHGFFRVDEWELPELVMGENVVAVEVAGYNANSYYLLEQPSFLWAEVVAGGEVLASTGGTGSPFVACLLAHRLQKVERYSAQRTFSEVYRLSPGWDEWRHSPGAAPAEAPCEVQPEGRLLPRRVACPQFAICRPVRHIASGTVRLGELAASPWKGRGLQGGGGELSGWPEDQLETIPSRDLQRLQRGKVHQTDQPMSPETALPMPADSFITLDFGVNLTGFIGLEAVCREPARLYLTFDELLTAGDVDFTRLGCVNIVALELAPGSYRFESFEPYTLRYLKLICLDGACEIRGVSLREYANPETDQAAFSASDDRMERVFRAGVETFRQNAVDLLMDCPQRERAGWLCDSFFTARAAFALSGNTRVEQAFLENYLLPESFPTLPEGMLPMCYPADHRNGRFIPNWALWFVVQLEEYRLRSGDRGMVDAFSRRVRALFDYFERFANEDGLLESLESWVFIEWSKANEFVQDVSYPTNMLYAAALAAAGRLYRRADWLDRAERLRQTIRVQSFDGEFFVDNAVRQGRRLVRTANRTEVGQYFAFFFDVASPLTHPDLWRTLLDQFGPKRKGTGAFADVHPANAFIGYMLRLELLSRHRLGRQLLDESVDCFLYMAERTGTLWEMADETASCNHGFASHVCWMLYRDVLGVRRIDPVGRAVEIRLPDVPLEWCRGRIPTPAGPVAVNWRKEGGRLVCDVSVPPGYTVRAENLSGLQAEFQSPIAGSEIT